ncbi:MAG: hypothetical protein J7516_09720 [Shinella sp.]|nr:hypothetical protein [Shinella sp.]
MGQNPALLTLRDGYVLEKMAADAPPLTEEWRTLLHSKLSSHRLALEGAIPADLAMIDARVTFRCASGLTDVRTLCLPGTYVPGGAFLPVTTFYGLALLGLREGQSMAFDRPEGRRDWVVLEKVLYQPASAQPAPKERPRIRLVAGGRFGQAFHAANENGPGEGPGPGAA